MSGVYETEKVVELKLDLIFGVSFIINSVDLVG